MNKKQKRILWIGIIIVVLMGLFPPYTYEIFRTHRSYGFLLDPPISSAEIDFARLTIQWIIVSVLTAGAIYTTKESKDKKDQKAKPENL